MNRYEFSTDIQKKMSTYVVVGFVFLAFSATFYLQQVLPGFIAFAAMAIAILVVGFIRVYTLPSKLVLTIDNAELEAAFNILPIQKKKYKIIDIERLDVELVNGRFPLTLMSAVFRAKPNKKTRLAYFACMHKVSSSVVPSEILSSEALRLARLLSEKFDVDVRVNGLISRT